MYENRGRRALDMMALSVYYVSRRTRRTHVDEEISEMVNIASEQEFFGSVVKMLAKYPRLTLGQIRNSTRAFRRRRRIPAESVFGILEGFVRNGWLKRTEINGRIAYATRIAEAIEGTEAEPENALKTVLISKQYGITTGEFTELQKRAIQRGIEMNKERELREQAVYTLPKPKASTEEERKVNEAARRVEHAKEIEQAEVDPLADLDGPETNDI